MAPFIYHRLEQNRKQIRILILKPAPNESDTIECELQTADLDDGSASYEALSYVWGSHKDPAAKIMLQGSEHTARPSLALALRHLRYKGRSRRLWVDAICINQNNLDERAAQVKIMREIYTRSETTVSWLGEAADESDDAMELIRALGDWTHEHHDEIFEYSSDDAGGDGNDQVTIPAEDGSIQTAADNWPAVCRLLERPYWTRVWIIQELAARGKLTKADGRICCGTKEVGRVQFGSFCGLILLLIMSGKTYRLGGTYETDEPAKSMLARGHPPGLSMVQTLAACTGEPKQDLNFLLRISARVEATDPRDKLFALLGLAADGDVLTPDYTKGYDEVLVDFVVSHIQRSRKFALNLQTTMAKRTFIVLEDEKMGVGPFLAQPGDIVAVYTLVGDAYVHRAMHGDFVKGLGPEDGQIFEVI
ncbi:heterokaryon incompatibility protein-domain-containing protein [Podospora didyma]|uniref:Heterokaryon incompatibility protein-domain-containing protein n=1 Tax=Podospora didyma TaxID=330526 RepID=A0AAE0NXY0_9PEZI|nr:heterokaryon incompatibility protein-domain-containing protein [Podospora didyma]